ncbi:FHA domain-containing protein [Mycobacterium sp.]|uniref:FHA domain-containing protein n=1 Tax=Mycobacterium sp. TaxID=1785 RepID=UPI0025FB6BF3|nr:FHA domain-containing protein [Mycobacterium sp.]
MTTDQLAAACPIAVQVGGQIHTVNPANGAAVIGRDPASAIRINDARISRAHVRLEPHQDGWHIVDTSTNGMFVDGVQRHSLVITGPTTLHLGDAEGIAVTLEPVDTSETSAASEPVAADTDDDSWDELSETDPDVARAGAAVAARRQELDLTQRSLARDKVISAGTLIAFEKGRSWPRRGTLARLEESLDWPTGTITRIRNGQQPVQRDEVTDVLTDSIQAGHMAEVVELAMHGINTAADALPGPQDPEFTARVTPILADLRKLESVAANAARVARGTPSAARALGTVRRRYNELMLRAAKSPTATLGQRLYGLRHRGELSIDEAANAAGVAPQAMLDAEAERHVAPDAVAAINALIAQLG